jgi:hypothetical protein
MIFFYLNFCHFFIVLLDTKKELDKPLRFILKYFFLCFRCESSWDEKKKLEPETGSRRKVIDIEKQQMRCDLPESSSLVPCFG